MSNLLVMKFGGTSVGSAERIRVAAGLAATERARRPVVVVVSAMSKITDLLLGTMRHAEAGDRAGMDANLAALRARHEEACRELLPEPRCSAVLERVHELIAEFERIVGGMAMLNERPPRSVDEAVAVGERLSALLLSEYLVSQGVAAEILSSKGFGSEHPVASNSTASGRQENRRVELVVSGEGLTSSKDTGI